MQDGQICEQITHVGHPIEETDGSASPTGETDGSRMGQMSLNLSSSSQENSSKTSSPPVSPKNVVKDLFPTPTVVHLIRNDEDSVEDYLERRRLAKEKAKNGNGFGLSLPMAVKMLPTPTAQAAKHGGTPDVTADGHGFNLWDLPHLLPTPRTSDTNGPGKRGEGGQDLRTAVSLLLPTPTSRDHKGRNQRDDDTCLHGAIEQHVTGDSTKTL